MIAETTALSPPNNPPGFRPPPLVRLTVASGQLQCQHRFWREKYQRQGRLPFVCRSLRLWRIVAEVEQNLEFDFAFSQRELECCSVLDSVFHPQDLILPTRLRRSGAPSRGGHPLRFDSQFRIAGYGTGDFPCMGTGVRACVQVCGVCAQRV